MFRGSIVALITPFRNGAVDENTLRELIDWHVDQGTQGIVPVGTTGESPTLSHDEHKRWSSSRIDGGRTRVPVIAGTGSNSTAEAIDFTQHAKKAGRRRRPGRHALLQQADPGRPVRSTYTAIAMRSTSPIIIYNIPGRCVVDMSVETMARWRSCRTSSASRTPPPTSRGRWPPRDRLRRRTSASSPARTRRSLAFLADGGHGCISVTANVAPRLCADMHNAWQAGDTGRASRSTSG